MLARTLSPTSKAFVNQKLQRKGQWQDAHKNTKIKVSPHVSPANFEVEDDEDDVNDKSLWDKPAQQTEDEEDFIPSRDRGLAFGSDTDNKEDEEDIDGSSDYGG